MASGNWIIHSNKFLDTTNWDQFSDTMIGVGENISRDFIQQQVSQSNEKAVNGSIRDESNILPKRTGQFSTDMDRVESQVRNS